MKRRHNLWCVPTPATIAWSCSDCGGEWKLLAVAAADPERLRSMLVVLEAPCSGTTAGRALPGAVS